MSTLPGKTVMITGANVGIGKDVARQLALRPETARIYLACRNRDRATTAKAELEAATGRRIFDIVVMDVADLGSVRAGLAAIDGSVDALVMNAGVIGQQSMELTSRSPMCSRRMFLATSSSSKGSWPRGGLARLRSSPEVKQPGDFRFCG